MTRPSPLCARTAVLTLTALFLLLLLLRNPALAVAGTERALRLLGHTLLPALFPFSVLAELLRASPPFVRLLRRLSRPLCRLLGVGEACGAAILTGLLCGAPVGAVSLMQALDEGLAEREECERALGIATLPSPAFLLGALPALLSMESHGLLFLAAVLAAALLSGLLLRKKHGVHRPSPPPHTSLSLRTFTAAVRHAADTMLTVAAFVLFFSILSEALSLVLSPLPPSVGRTVSLLLELSDGVRRAAEADEKIPAACMAAFAAGWSGLSVHCQIGAICEGHGVRLNRYFLCKACTGILSALLCGLALSAMPSLP